MYCTSHKRHVSLAHHVQERHRYSCKDLYPTTAELFDFQEPCNEKLIKQVVWAFQVFGCDG